MNLFEKHGVGVNYLYETIGLTQTQKVKLNYNYQLKLDETRKLAFGAAFIFQDFRLNPEWIPPTSSSLWKHSLSTPPFTQSELLHYRVSVSNGFCEVQSGF